MGDERQLLNAIGEIYEAATDPGLMANLGGVIGQMFDTDSAIMTLCGMPTSSEVELVRLLSATANFDSWARSSYAQHFHQRDEWYSRGLKKGIPAIVIGQELIDDVSFSRTEFCTDWCEKIGFFHVLGTHFSVDDMIGAIGLHKPRKAKRFNNADRRKMELLLPHLQRALQIHRRLSVAEWMHNQAVDCIDHVNVGAIVVARDGRVLFANKVAERVLSSGDGITVAQGRVRPCDPRLAARFEKAIAAAATTSAGAGTSAGECIKIARTSGAASMLLISPLRRQVEEFGPALPAAIIVFSNPDGVSSTLMPALARTHGLTSAETKLLLAIVAGQSLMDHADAAGITRNTAKRHLDHIFYKTGHHRQIDLIRAVLADQGMESASELISKYYVMMASRFPSSPTHKPR